MIHYTFIFIVIMPNILIDLSQRLKCIQILSELYLCKINNTDVQQDVVRSEFMVYHQ